MLHLLTRTLARAPLRASVSAVTVAMIAGASLLTASPAPATPEQPDLALATASPATTSESAPVSASLQRPAAADLTCLAKAVYYEARGESEEGQAAVAQVVLNRTHRPEYAHNVCGVVFQGAHAGQCQFSFACNGAMHRPIELAAWSRARRIALAVYSGARHASVGAATSFHTAEEGGGARAVAGIGGHLFFAASRV